jgi:hypothetical protein
MAVRPAFGNQNTGEQLLWENSTLYSATPLGATAEKVTFPANAFFSNTNLPLGQFDAVIVNGAGLGQHRKIVAVNGSTLTISPAWNVAPDTTSTVLVAGVVSHCAVYQNSLEGKSTYVTQVTASTGIQPFGNSFDFIADGNTISQVRTGIALWGTTNSSQTPLTFSPVYFNYIVNNSIDHCLNGIVGISAAYGWSATAPFPGYYYLGNVCANNTIISNSESGLAQSATDAPLSDQQDLNVFARNVVSGTPVGLDLQSSDHIKNTLSYKNTLGPGGTVTQ